MSTVIVSGIPADVSQEALNDFFSRVGPVSELALQGDGTARVTLEHAEDLSAALDLNGSEYREGVLLSVTAAAAAAPADAAEETGDRARKPRYEEGKAIVVRNIPAALRDEAKVREVFGACGEITDLFIDSRSGRFIFLSFATTEAAEAAVARNGEEIEGSAIAVEMRHPQPPKHHDVRLVAKNLPVGVTETQVRELFGEAGTLTDVFLKADRQICFISYATAEEGDRAMALQGREIGDKHVEVERREASKRCFKCGKEGHIGAECRSGGGGGRGRGGDRGDRGGGGGMVCFKCGRVGHKAVECREGPGGNVSRGGRGGAPPRRDIDRRDDFRDRRRRRSDSYDRPARRRSRSPPSFRRRSPPSRSRSPPRQRQRRHSRSRTPPRRRY